MAKSKLSEELIRESGVSSDEDLEDRVGRIHEVIQRDKSKFRQMKWITASLWVLTFVMLLLVQSRPMAISNSGREVGVSIVYLAILAQTLPICAIISTVLLLVRLLRSSRKETNLRLTILEERLRSLEKNRRKD